MSSALAAQGIVAPHVVVPTPPSSPGGGGGNGVCPAAPPGMQAFADEIQGWIKWVVITLMAGAFVASIGMLVWGRVTHHPRGARIGFDGLIIVLVAAVLLVAGYNIVLAIIGSGC